MNRVRPANYLSYYVPVLLLSMTGICLTTYLSLSHYWMYADIYYSSFCALSKAINCDTVSQSAWSVMLGLPLPVWGVSGYLLFAVILFFARRELPERTSLWTILLLLGTFYSSFSIYLGYVSATKIHSYCLLCIASYLISFLLMYMSWIIRRRFSEESFGISLPKGIGYLWRNRLSRVVLLILISSFFLTYVFYPHYWHFSIPPFSEDIETGITEEGHPWIGAEHPEITIEEFADYQCFQCYKMHYILRRLVAQQPEKIRLVHRHYPLDHEFNAVIVPEPFHVGSGKMALMAISAVQTGNFWKVNDVLFQLARSKKPFSTEELAGLTGIPSGAFVQALDEPRYRKLLQIDIHRGMKLRMTATPSYVIDDEVYQGGISLEILKEIIQ
jgi:uncharacterized membrane protein